MSDEFVKKLRDPSQADAALLRQALEALTAPRDAGYGRVLNNAIAALRARLGEKK